MMMNTLTHGMHGVEVGKRKDHFGLHLSYNKKADMSLTVIWIGAAYTLMLMLQCI